MQNVAVITKNFLPITQTFIYQELTAIKNFKVIVLTRQRFNKKMFPYKDLYVCKNINDYLKAIKKQNIQLLHIKFGYNGLHYYTLKEQTGLPLIVSFHGGDASARLKDPSTHSAYQDKLFPIVDRIVVVSHTLKNNLVQAGCPENKIVVIPSGIDLEKFYYKPRTIKENEPIKILCIGRLTEKKGHQYLIEAFARIVKQKPNVQLRIIGRGSLKCELQNQIYKLELQEKVVLQDFVAVDEVANILHEHHLFCLPSITANDGNQEGTPNVLKEACATGMPVVSTYHSGIPELVFTGKNGFLVDEKDSVQLADKLIYLIDHPEIWESMGKWGRKHVEKHYERSEQARKIENLYSGLIG